MKMKGNLLAIILLSLLMTGCSSVMGGSSYDVLIDSAPNNAHFFITNRAGQQIESGVTPSTVTLTSSAGFFKGEDYQVVFKKQGYEQNAYRLNTYLDPWYFANIIALSGLGMFIVDPLTGAMFNLDEDVKVSLIKNVQQDADFNLVKVKISPKDKKSE